MDSMKLSRKRQLGRRQSFSIQWVSVGLLKPLFGASI